MIVPNLPQQCTYDDVGSFFENEVSSGGKVKRIIRLRDGYLIVFDKAKCKLSQHMAKHKHAIFLQLSLAFLNDC